MNQPTIFSSGLELGNFFVGSGLLHYLWDKIIDSQNENCSNDPNAPLSIRYKVYPHPKFGTIIIFVSSPFCTTQHFHEDLISSKNLKSKFPDFEFVGTKLNPSFSINKAAVDLYASIQNELSSLKQYVDIRPLIITGYSIGGSIASLFSLWLLENMSPKGNECPLCITFGSPFLGDIGFQKAILERPTWHLSFLHVVSIQDPILYLDSTRNYKPFGTFLLCSGSGCAFFEESDSVLDLMVKNSMVRFSNFGTNEPLRVSDYGNVLKKLKLEALLRGVSRLGECEFSPLQTGLMVQIKAIFETTQANSDITEIEKKMIGLLNRKRNVLDPKAKLNDMKINMTYIEWYKKKALESKMGYYDSFKNTDISKQREEIVKRKKKLTLYWTKMVKEVEKLPKKESKFSEIAYLYGGTNYRRMIEPLDIAEWYKKGKTNYIETRSEHYKLLEKWLNDDQKTARDRKIRACSLTEDSCFWARVEEAIKKCESLSGLGGDSLEAREKLLEDLVSFENYVMSSIQNYAVSTEIFLEQSSFMKWWEKYEKIKGDNYSSLLVDFMRNRNYKKYA